RSFRGRGSDSDRTSWPPSPARLIGALLSGAHALRPVHGVAHTVADTAVAAVNVLTRAPLPLIVTGEDPVELGNGTIWYAPKHADGSSLGVVTEQSGPVITPSVMRAAKVLAAIPGADNRNRVAKPRTLSVLPARSKVRYIIDADIGPGQIDALGDAAELIGHFGASTDTATVTVAATDGWELLDGEVVWTPSVDKSDGDVVVRGWTAGTVSFFNDVFDAGGTAVSGDFRVPMVGYRRSSDPADVDRPSPELLVRPLRGGPVPLRDYARLHTTASSLCGTLDVAIHPATDRNRGHRVRGLILSGADRGEAIAALDPLLDLGATLPHTSLNPNTWSGPATSWESATALVAHSDPVVARGEAAVFLADLGLRLVAITDRPWLHGQAAAPVPEPGYGCWYVTATSDEERFGPIRFGRFQDTGAGMLAPAAWSANAVSR
ncbi:MAG: hypothetical protein WAV90_09130, partial [Gordonia amarae]